MPGILYPLHLWPVFKLNDIPPNVERVEEGMAALSVVNQNLLKVKHVKQFIKRKTCILGNLSKLVLIST